MQVYAILWPGCQPAARKPPGARQFNQNAQIGQPKYSQRPDSGIESRGSLARRALPERFGLLTYQSGNQAQLIDITRTLFIGIIHREDYNHPVDPINEPSSISPS